MPMTLMYAVALALAATVTMCIAPVALWRGNEQAVDVPSASPSQLRGHQAVSGLHLPQR